MGRKPLPDGSTIILGNVEYTITGVSGEGSNSIVYTAEYTDNLNSDRRHLVFLKELFPLENNGRIYRDANGKIVCDGAEQLFELHRQSFLRGNSSHLLLLEKEDEGIGGNFNSFEHNGTLYTILEKNGAETLERCMPRFRTLQEQLKTVLAILEALELFHKNGMLHLDISPDNMIMQKNKSVLLIDYNSVWSLEELSGHNGIYFSKKEGYTAPEILTECGEICSATDLFSVSAVLFQMITGQRLCEDDIYQCLRGRAVNMLRTALEQQTMTVALKVRNVLRKGLSISPTTRYQSCAEYTQAIQEIIDLTELRGVNEAVLWELSLRSLHRNEQPGSMDNLIPNSVLVGQKNIEDALSFFENAVENGTDIILTGEGGMGKSTLLQRTAGLFLQKYKPGRPVVRYISLADYNGSSGKTFLSDTLIFGISPENETVHQEDIRHALYAQLQSGALHVYLLLDGWNEIGDDSEQLLSELHGLSDCKGFHFAVSSRVKPFEPFSKSGAEEITLCGLPQKEVTRFLSENGIPSPENEAVFGLLSNPLMLRLYVQTVLNSRQSGLGSGAINNISNPKALIFNYVRSLETCYNLAHSADSAACVRGSYYLQCFAPMLAQKMLTHKGALNHDEMLSFAEENMSLLRSRSFSRVFPAFAGKSRVLLRDIHSGAEWFDCAVQDGLIGQFSLLRRSEDGYFRFSHDLITEAFAEKGDEYQKELKSYKRKKKLPVLAGCSAAFVCVAIALVFGIRSFVLPEKSASLAEKARAFLEEGRITESVETARESVSLLNKKKDTDSGVLVLRSALATQEFIQTDKSFHEEYTLSFGNESVSFLGMSKDGSAAVFCDGVTVDAYDIKSGILIEKYHLSEPEKIAELLDKSESSLSEPVMSKHSSKELRHGKYTFKTAEDNKLIMSDGADEYTFKNVEPDSFRYCFNRDDSVFALYGGRDIVFITDFDGGFSANIYLGYGMMFVDMVLSPKGNYLFVQYLDPQKKCPQYKVYDVSRNIQTALLGDGEWYNKAGDTLILTDAFDGYVFFMQKNEAVKYSFDDYAPKAELQKISDTAEIAEITADGSRAFGIDIDVGDYGTGASAEYTIFETDTGEMLFSRKLWIKESNEIFSRFSVDPAFNTCAWIENGVLYIYDLQSAQLLYREDKNSFVSVGVNDDGTQIITGTQTGDVFIYKFYPDHAEKEVPEESFGKGAFAATALCGNTAFISDEETGTMYLYDLNKKKTVLTATDKAVCINRCTSSDFLHGELIICDSASDGTVMILDRQTGKGIHSKPLIFADYSEKSGILAYTEYINQLQDNSQITVARYENGSIKKLYTYTPESASAWELDSEGECLFINTQNDNSVVLDAGTGTELLKLNGRKVYCTQKGLFDTDMPFLPYALPSAHFYKAEELPEK